MKITDQYFDGIAAKFAKNIYGTTKGRLRHMLLIDAMMPFLANGPSKILDIGGGTGVMTKTLADLGHQVTLTDASEEVLTLAREMLADTPDVTIVQQTLDQAADLHSYDFIVCHAVLEWLARPFDAIDLIFQNMAPGKLLSLSFFNRDAALFGNALYGNFDYISRGMKVKNQVRLNPDNPLRPAEVIQHAEGTGFSVESITGIRCFHDYMKEKPSSDAVFDQLVALERQYNQTPPYCWLGKYIHLMLRKSAES
ncbi:methyltransferase domain-containing protein [Alteromonas pelagimontana]|uniref:tRNA 5-carboxymethoxyuridine methyltransferase n=1 Tax=Alteromonas pelagimontana TaxID=1858656 RepID=A0A6M4MIW7_9ALTE|nr:methyltransferase [Alteromonas pelagimontana]QJR82550.1 methyltransferase domain-containing protein [Alteromonas pelagimontana]